MSDRAADRAAMANLRVADLGRRLGEYRALRRQQLARGDVVVAGQAPIAIRSPSSYVRELREPADVDEQRRTGEAELHERQQRVTAGEELRVVGLTEQPDRSSTERATS